MEGGQHALNQIQPPMKIYHDSPEPDLLHVYARFLTSNKSYRNDIFSSDIFSNGENGFDT